MERNKVPALNYNTCTVFMFGGLYLVDGVDG